MKTEVMTTGSASKEEEKNTPSSLGAARASQSAAYTTQHEKAPIATVTVRNRERREKSHGRLL